MAKPSFSVFLTGGSGFVGTAVLDELLKRGHSVNALDSGKMQPRDNARIVKGELFSSPALDEGLRDADAVIHLVGIIMEVPGKGVTFQHIHVDGTQAILDAIGRANGQTNSRIKRYIHMSSLGTRPNAVAEYHRTKFAAEQLVQASSLPFTIIRPSMIHGPGGFMKMEAKWARKQAPPFFAMPYFGAGLLGTGGAGMLQPVFVNDVARAFVDALESDTMVSQTYEMGGRDRVTWPQMHRIASKAIVGHERATLAVPVWNAMLQAAILPTNLAPFNRDQIIMSQENNVCDLASFERDFCWTPEGFEASLQHYVEKL